MFARLKDNGSGGIYVQVVHSYRRRGAWGTPTRKPLQRVIATLGRVDHLPEGERERVKATLTAALSDIVPTAYRRSAKVQRAAVEAELRGDDA